MTPTASTRDRPAAGPDLRPGWRASLRLRLGPRHGGTRILERVHEGPLLVQRPFYPEADGRCHAYIVHPPGGVVGGDRLAVRVDVTDGGQALLTTPSATRLYRDGGRSATVSQHLTVSDGSTLEWLPQETIAFDGSHARLATSVILEPEATYLGWDVLCLGRPASGEDYALGDMSQRLEIRREGRLLIDERLVIDAAGPELRAPWGLGRHTTLANLVAVVPGEVPVHLLASVRAILPASGLAAVTRVSGALVVRALCDSARDAHELLRAVWQVTRPALIGREPVAPRIWTT
jgi:urease accessory protein